MPRKVECDSSVVFAAWCVMTLAGATVAMTLILLWRCL